MKEHHQQTLRKQKSAVPLDLHVPGWIAASTFQRESTFIACQSFDGLDSRARIGTTLTRCTMRSDSDPGDLGTVTPISNREAVHESLRTVVVFGVLITVWAALRLYARHVRYTPVNVEDSLFYISVVRLLCHFDCFSQAHVITSSLSMQWLRHSSFVSIPRGLRSIAAHLCFAISVASWWCRIPHGSTCKAEHRTTYTGTCSYRPSR